jgi:hypothetical protein
MVGLFPKDGVSKDSALNAAELEVAGLCEALFYANKCNTKFDAGAANAAMSEVLNAINLMIPYDCKKLDNLRTALELIRNLCLQPTRPLSISNSFLAGCFGGESGKITIQSLIDAIIGGGGGDEPFTICGLPEKETMLGSDGFGACANSQQRRISLDQLGAFIGGNVAITPTVVSLGEYIGTAQDFQEGPLTARVPIQGRSVMIFQDLRPDGGDPGSIAGMTVDAVDVNTYSNGVSGANFGYREYGQIIPLITAKDPLNPQSSTKRWFAIHKSGHALRLDNSSANLPNFIVRPPSDRIFIYGGSVLI